MLKDLQTQIANTLTETYALLSPIGLIALWAGETAPEGWQFCDGQALSRHDYPKTFKIVGVTFGEGDGLTTFNLPKLPSVVPSVRFIIRAGSPLSEMEPDQTEESAQ